jgi:hypothetical protein
MTAAAAYAESLQIWRDLGDSWWSASPLAGAAALACALDRFALAAHLLGAAARLRETSGTETQPHERARDEATVTAARLGLGDEAYAKEFAIGQRLSPDEAIAKALEIAKVFGDDLAALGATDGPAGSERSESSTH